LGIIGGGKSAKANAGEEFDGEHGAVGKDERTLKRLKPGACEVLKSGGRWNCTYAF
jgi:hypothetical protein